MKKTLFTMTVSLLFFTTFSQRIVFVDKDATGTGDGTSWTNAYIDAQTAFSNANKGDIFWIAEGTYVRQTTLRNKSFSWDEDSVSVYGGFDGTETTLNQRDWENNLTIFSGEIQGDNDLTNNAYTVFLGPIGTNTKNINYSFIDGISINDGYAITNSSSTYNKWGAGFYLSDYVRKLDFNNCTFKNNTAQGGAAMYTSAVNLNTNVTVTNTKFIGNKSSFASCVYGKSNSSKFAGIEVINCLFTDNTNKYFGGAQNGSVFYFSSEGYQANISVNLLNNTITANIDSTSIGSGSQIIMLTKTASIANTTLLVKNSIIYNNPLFRKTTGYSQISTFSYNFSSNIFSNCISEITSYSNTSLTSVYTHNPKFTDTLNGDYTLQSTSPAIDSGNTLGSIIPSVDLAGNPRIKGTAIDLGCYEYQTSYAGLNENKKFNSLYLFPNPTNGRITFESNEKIESIEMYTITGQKINTFLNTSSVEISNYNPGVYLAIIKSGDKIFTNKIIKK